MMTDAFSGRAARALRSRYALEMIKKREPLLEFPLLYSLTDPLIEALENGPDFGFHLYGQSAAFSRDVPAGELVKQLVAETEREIMKLVT